MPRLDKVIIGVVDLLAAMIFIIGFFNIVGYTTDTSVLFQWSDTPMALSTAIALAATGSCLGFIGVILHLRSPYVYHIKSIPVQTKIDTIVTQINLQPNDVIAAISLIGCFTMMLFGYASDVIGILVVVVGFYFGRVAQSANKAGIARNGKLNGH